MILPGGNLTDLYDFDYDSPGEGGTFVQAAASLQASYNAAGMPGHVYRYTVNFDNYVALPQAIII